MDLPDIVLYKIQWYIWKHNISKVIKEYHNIYSYRRIGNYDYISFKIPGLGYFDINYRDINKYYTHPEWYCIHNITTRVHSTFVNLPKYYCYSKRYF